MQQKINYLNNEDFIALLKKHFEEKRQNPDIGCPNEIAAMFLIIAQKYICKWASSITNEYREDMIMFAVEYCLRYMYNYNPEKYHNPFAYFTEIIKSAFMQKFNHEKKKRTIVKNASENFAEEHCYVRIKNNMKTFRTFNNPIDSQIELDAIEENDKKKVEDKVIIFWEDEMVVQGIDKEFLDELFFKKEAIK